MTAAGQRLGISRSAVSQRLENIEEKIGHTLATRKGRVTLTPAGREVLEYCLNAKRSQELLQNTLQRLQEPSLRIIADEVLLKQDLPLVVQQLLIEKPTLKVTLDSGSFSEIIRSVIDGIADAGLIAGDPHVAGLRLIPYRKERVCLLMSSSHPLSQQRVIPFSAVIRYPLINTSTLEHITPIINDLADKVGIKLIYPLTCPSFNVQAKFASTTDIGIALTIESAAKIYAKTHSVCIVHLTDDWADNQLSICVREIGSLSEATNDLVRLIVALNNPTY